MRADIFMRFAYTFADMKKLSENCKENVKSLKSILTSEDILVFQFETKDKKTDPPGKSEAFPGRIF